MTINIMITGPQDSAPATTVIARAILELLIEAGIKARMPSEVSNPTDGDSIEALGGLKKPAQLNVVVQPSTVVRGAHAFEACEDGALIIWAAMPNSDGEPIRIEPHRVKGVLCACADALVREANTY